VGDDRCKHHNHYQQAPEDFLSGLIPKHMILAKPVLSNGEIVDGQDTF
jgi:hypothetical protein